MAQEGHHSQEPIDTGPLPSGISSQTAMRADFLARGTVSPQLRKSIVQSWLRSRAAGVDPANTEVLQCPARHESPAEMSEALAQAVRWQWKPLERSLKGLPHSLAWLDAKGTVLAVSNEGSAAPAQPAASLFQQGANWLEGCLGSNGPGTSLVLGRPLFLAGHEHYLESLVTWTTMGVPVRTPGGTIIGALGLGLSVECPFADVWTALCAAAGEIEAELLEGCDPFGTVISARSCSDAAGRPIGSIGVFTDITARKHAEIALVRERELFAAIVENIPVLLCIWNPDLKSFHFNRHMWEVLGWTEADAQEGDFLAKVYPDPAYRQEVADYMRSLARGVWHDFKTTAADGAQVDISWANVELPDGRAIGIGLDLRARKRTEAQLLVYQERMEFIMDRSEVGFWIWEIEQDQIQWSKWCYRHFKVPEGEPLNFERFLSAVHPEDQERVARTVGECLQRGGPGEFNLEYRIDWPDGSVRWLQAIGGSSWEGGRAVRMAGVDLDITRRKLAEEGLRLSEESLRLAVEGSNAAEWELAVDPAQEEALSDRIFISARLKGFIGFSDDEFPSSRSAWFDRIHPEDVARIREKADEHRRQRNPGYQVEYRIRHKNGEWRWISSTGQLFRDSQGHARRWAGLDWDITIRKEAEAALRQSEAEFRQLAEAMPQLVWTANSEGIIEYYNSRIHLYAGARRHADGAWEWERILHPEDRERTWEAWRKAVTKGTVYQAEHRVCLADGTYRWHLSRAEPARDPAGRVVKWFGTATDIDDQKRAQETLELKVRERTARLQDTVADLEHFSYTITHDMRAPLRAMHAFAEILREDYGARFDDVGRDYLRRITEAANRMDNLITDALNYSKATRSELVLEPIDPGSLLRGIVESYPILQPPKAEIELAGRFPLVLGNQSGLTQCISNLLGNAVKFVERDVTPQVKVWAEERGEWVRLWFEDNGIGIPPDQQERVFVMFQRLSHDYEGTGVGLALVRKVVQRMQGQVGFESPARQGTRFWVDLRRAPDGEQRPSAPL